MANSKVLVKNDKVIVTEWSFKVGDSTGHHKHEYNYGKMLNSQHYVSLIERHGHMETVLQTAFVMKTY